MSIRTIYESPHLRVVFRPGSSSFGLVTFNPATMIAKGDAFWGQAIADEADLTTIGVMTHRSNWYPASEMRKAAEIIRPLLAGFAQVIGYGSMMGGYGALKHSRLLGLTHILSFAPQWSIAPHDVGDWDKRFVREYRQDLNADVRIEAGDVLPAPIIVYDPYLEPDRQHVEHIVAACPGARLVPAYLTGSEPAGLFKATSQVLGLFEACLAGDVDRIARQATTARRDPASDLRPRALAELYIRSNMKAASRLMERRPHAFPRPRRGGINHLLAGQFMAKGLLEEADACSAASIADLPTVRDFHFRRASIAERRKDFATAIAAWKTAIETWPKDVTLHLQLASTLLAAGDIAAAGEAQAAAAAIEPDSVAVITAAARQAHAVGDQAMEVSWTRRLFEIAPTSQSCSRLSDLLTQLGDHAGASQALERLVAISPGAASWKLLAEGRVRERRPVEAAEALIEALRLEPNILGKERAAIVYNSEHLRVMYHPGSSEYALIAFNPPTWLASGTNYWCRPIVEQAGITAVGIMTHRSNWYPAEDMKQAILVINRLLQGYQEIIAYGSSMGGYGVLKYGRALNATRVLSFAPQWSIAPIDVGQWDRRFVANYRPDLNGEMAIHAGDVVENAFIFYDPFFKEDRLNVDRIVELNPAAHLVTAHLTGYFAVAVFDGMAMTLRLFELCLANDLQGLRRQTAINRRDPARHTRVRALTDIYLKSDPVAVQRVLDQRPQAFGAAERASVNYQLAAYYSGTEDLEKAAACCAAAVAGDANVPEFHTRWSAIEERRQNYPAAVSLAEEAVRRWPKHLRANLQLFDVLMSSGDTAAAQAPLATAFALDPNFPQVITAKLRLAKATGDQKEAVRWSMRLVELSPTAGSILQCASFMTSIGKHANASEVLRRLVVISPTNASYWQMLAGSYLREPRNVLAAEAAEKAIRLEPNNQRSYHIAIAGYSRAGMREYAARNEIALDILTMAEAPTETESIGRRKRPVGWRAVVSAFTRQKPARGQMAS
ncbi:MAG: tetratricopeptide repeat protein [Janthinobacterium lividum]